jgi:hypothetical protein
MLRALIICALIISLKGASQVFTANIVTTNLSAGATQSHSLVLAFLNYTLNSNSYLFVNYSSNWNIGSITKIGATDFCETGCTLSNVSISNISQNIKITNLFPNNYTNTNFTLQYTINNIINPNRSIS